MVKKKMDFMLISRVMDFKKPYIYVHFFFYPLGVPKKGKPKAKKNGLKVLSTVSPELLSAGMTKWGLLQEPIEFNNN